ncbi:MAG: ArsR/SmtB family transcription factor [Pseudonocardia sp.]
MRGVVSEEGMERIFVALSNATRRRLLDSLFARDSQRPVELMVDIDMSRQAVLKHLAVLEDAGLVRASRSAGRTVYHLDPALLEHVHRHWLGKFTLRSSS